MTAITAQQTDTLLDALRSNLTLLGEIAMRYAVEVHPERPTGDVPSIGCPEDVSRLLGPEMAPLAQEQLKGAPDEHQEQRRRPAGRLPGQRELVDDPAGRGAAPRRHGGRPQHHRLPQPSLAGPDAQPEDAAITRELAQAGKLLGIELLDHVVIGGDRFVSLKERGLIAA